MGLKKLVKGLTATTDDLHREHLAVRFGDLAMGQAQLCDCPLRTRVRVMGEVTGVRVVPRSGTQTLEVTLDDGTGTGLAVFTGRRRIRGLDPGRGVLLEGVARKEKGRITLVNPAYTLLP